MTHHAVTSNIYLDMLQLYAVPQFSEGVIFQHNDETPHYGNIVREFLDTTFPQRWIGRGAVMAWPPRSPDAYSQPLHALTPQRFSSLLIGWLFRRHLRRI
ncbi:hypothetical protein AVEN_143240-1 [Araneus ventricosus]|uniref:Tc1-like transposase DDE domain-containing protein n=1 Tax=Araneus ventricosus TaxID=182803 RepID=A0A4Y2AF87_ARAVE|nr:hypothetical protein AVEN_143240-1 [Araneus ventricosus]